MALPDPPWPPAGRPAERLTVDGPHLLLAATGTRVRLRGLNRSGLQHKPSLAAAGWPEDPRDELRAWRTQWNAHVLRLPLALDGLAPDSAYEADVDRLVAAAEEVGLYLMLELHGRFDEPHPLLPPLDQTVRVWRRLAERHGRREHLIFDLWNEPHPEALLGGLWGARRRAAWEMWRECAQRLIDVLREAGAEQTLLVAGGIDWSYDLSALGARRARLAGRGPLAYAAHVYPFKGRPAHRREMRQAEWRRAFADVARELPVLVTEFGVEPGPAHDPHFPDTGTEQARAWLSDWLAFADGNELSALAWSAGDRPHLVLDRAGQPPRDLRAAGPDPARPSTPFGELVRGWLRGPGCRERH